MKPRKLIAPLTIFFIFLSGFFLQTINFLEVKTDAVSSATKSDYESGGYDHFLQKFQLPPAANNYEILSLHEKEAIYTVLVNTEKEGGASASSTWAQK
ncbi:MAG: hypothetical protein ACLUIQ_06650 [Dialister invisus]